MKGTYHHGNDATEVCIGNEVLMKENSLELPDHIQALLAQWKSEGKSVAIAAIKLIPENIIRWEIVAAFAISDPVRPEAHAVIKALRARGTEVWMLSGDNIITGM